MTRGLTKQRELEIEERRRIVAANVLAGLNYRDMATQLNVSIGTISNDVKMVAKRYREEQISEYADIVQLELRRIDTALNAIWEKVKVGSKGDIELMLMLQNQRAKYLALFEPDINRFEILFPNQLNAGEQLSLEEIRRKRWEQIFPQVKKLTGTILDVEAKDVTESSNVSDEPGAGDSDRSTHDTQPRNSK